MKSYAFRLLTIVSLLLAVTVPALSGDDHQHNQSLVQIADLVGNDMDLALPAPGETTERKIHSPDASFIKVHFDYFNMPVGAFVEVSSPDGTEMYRYSSIQKDGFTFDETMGQDGINSFSSMSISGDTAVIRIVNMSDEEANHPGYGAFVGRHSVGFPNEVIKRLAGYDMPIRAAKPGTGGENESTCGALERYDVACYETSHPTEFANSHAVARILIGGSSLCTAWRVGDDNFMLTNNHCVSSQSGISATEVWFNYQRTNCGGGNIATTTKVTGNTLFATDYNLDYTLYSVNSFSSITSFGNLGLDPRIPTLGEEIYIPQHGAGDPKQFGIESDRNTGGICAIDDAVANGRAVNTDTGYFCDTTGGSSGSPVLARASHRAIALHHFGGCTNQGVLISEIWPQIMSYFPNGVPQGSNGSNPPPPAGITLNTNGYKIKGVHTVDLSWSGASSTNVDIYRDGSLIATVANSGSYTDSTGNKGKGSYSYQVCEAGTSTCSGSSNVTF